MTVRVVCLGPRRAKIVHNRAAGVARHGILCRAGWSASPTAVSRDHAERGTTHVGEEKAPGRPYSSLGNGLTYLGAGCCPLWATATSLHGAPAKGPSQQPSRAARAEFSVGYTGVDYINPASGLTGCLEWTWLQGSCYSNSALTISHLSPQQLFASDLSFINAQHLGSFQRVSD